MEGRLILAGGGSREEELPLYKVLVQWLGCKGRLLYWPMAMSPEGGRHALCKEWICRAFEPLRLHSITMWSDFVGKSEQEVSEFDAVFLGGGCTYLLLHQLKASGFDRVLKEYFNRGGTIFGGSAGAIVLGKDIETCAHMDRNVCNLTDLQGLNLVNGVGVACHYHLEHDGLLQACAKRIQAPVIALPECSGLIIEAGQMRVTGPEPIPCFTLKQRMQLHGSFDIEDITA